MKRTLKEDLERIHELTYGKKVITESGFIDKILNTVGLGSDDKPTEKIDDPKKADLVSDDVAKFYENIKTAADAGGLSQQEHGSMNYQKEVESMQIGLLMLDYQLPQHGVDGLFGPETASAVEKFKIDNNISDSSDTPLNETMVQLKSTSYPNVKFDTDGTQNDQVNQGLLDDIQKAADAAGIVATITTAKTGHNERTTTGNVSRHMNGTGVDIAILDGEGSNGASNGSDGNDRFREMGNKLKDALVSLGYVWNTEVGNPKAVLWQTNTGGNHFNHLHVSNKEGASELDASVSGGSSMTMSKATPEMLNKLLESLKQKGVTSEDLKKYIDAVKTGGGAAFTDLDLTTDSGYKTYSEICQKFINNRQPNLLGITGDMMAKGAKGAFDKYQRFVPAELALAQLATEGGIGNKDPNSRPIRTKNPFNVGNTDSGANVEHNEVQSGINTYYNLIAKNYLGKGKTANDLVQNFVNHNGNRYASGTDYESTLNKIAGEANRIAQPIVASTSKTNGSDMA